MTKKMTETVHDLNTFELFYFFCVPKRGCILIFLRFMCSNNSLQQNYNVGSCQLRVGKLK